MFIGARRRLIQSETLLDVAVILNWIVLGLVPQCGQSYHGLRSEKSPEDNFGVGRHNLA